MCVRSVYIVPYQLPLKKLRRDCTGSCVETSFSFQRPTEIFDSSPMAPPPLNRLNLLLFLLHQATDHITPSHFIYCKCYLLYFCCNVAGNCLNRPFQMLLFLDCFSIVSTPACISRAYLCPACVSNSTYPWRQVFNQPPTTTSHTYCFVPTPNSFSLTTLFFSPSFLPFFLQEPARDFSSNHRVVWYRHLHCGITCIQHPFRLGALYSFTPLLVQAVFYHHLELF